MTSAATASEPGITRNDRTLLRDLAQRVEEIAALPVQAERKELWTAHNSLRPCRPMMLIFPEGAWQELLPAETCQCETEPARRIEGQLRRHIYQHEHFADDTVVEAVWPVRKVVHNTGWGLQPKRIASTETRGAWLFDPVIKTPADLEKMHAPEIAYDERATRERLTLFQELFGDILDVDRKSTRLNSSHYS